MTDNAALGGGELDDQMGRSESDAAIEGDTRTKLMIVHGRLEILLAHLLRLRPLIAEAGADTNFAIGHAAGRIEKAKALVGRDIDQLSGRN
jgi:hypothetical protein